MPAALRSDSPLRSKSDAFDLQTPFDFPIHDRGAPASQRLDGLCTESPITRSTVLLADTQTMWDGARGALASSLTPLDRVLYTLAETSAPVSHET